MIDFLVTCLVNFSILINTIHHNDVANFLANLDMDESTGRRIRQEMVLKTPILHAQLLALSEAQIDSSQQDSRSLSHGLEYIDLIHYADELTERDLAGIEKRVLSSNNEWLQYRYLDYLEAKYRNVPYITEYMKLRTLAKNFNMGDEIARPLDIVLNQKASGRVHQFIETTVGNALDSPDSANKAYAIEFMKSYLSTNNTSKAFSKRWAPFLKLLLSVKFKDDYHQLNLIHAYWNLSNDSKTVVDHLLTLLKTGNRSIRFRTVFLLAKIGRPATPAVPAIRELMDDDKTSSVPSSLDYYSYAIWKITKQQEELDIILKSSSTFWLHLLFSEMTDNEVEAIAPLLFEQLKESDLNRQVVICGTLFRLGEKATPAIPDIIKLIRSGNSTAVSVSVSTLQHIAPKQDSPPPYVLRFFKDPANYYSPDRVVLNECNINTTIELASMYDLFEMIIPRFYLILGSNTPQDEVRQMIILKCLGERKLLKHQYVKYVTPFLSHRTPYLRQAALYALDHSNIFDNTSSPLLLLQIARLCFDRDPIVRLQAYSCFHSLLSANLQQFR